MSTTKLINANVVLPDGSLRRAPLVVGGERITSVDDPDGGAPFDGEIELGGCTIFAGFVDVHNHGAVGVDVNGADAEGLLKVAEYLATCGVTSWMPTLVPDSDENYRRVIGEIDRLMELQAGKPVAQAVGVHYEGVFANEKMCGALRPEFFKKFSGHELGELPRLRKGVHMTTFAPEIEGGVALAAELTKQGWIASIGHTRADAATLDAAFAAGARHMTHFFNAMTGIHHRDVGVAGWGLTNQGVTFDIIADGVHVDPRMLGFACRAKTPEKVSLISDSVALTGLGDGEFKLWGETIKVVNGRTQNERGSIAGSVSTMLNGVRMMRRIGFSDNEVAAMASHNPARLLGIDASTGSIGAGKIADLVAIDSDGNVAMTMIRGQIVPK